MENYEISKKKKIQALENYLQAHFELSNEWMDYDHIDLNDLDANKFYPFGCCFYELYDDVSKWINNAIKELENESPIAVAVYKNGKFSHEEIVGSSYLSGSVELDYEELEKIDVLEDHQHLTFFHHPFPVESFPVDVVFCYIDLK